MSEEMEHECEGENDIENVAIEDTDSTPPMTPVTPRSSNSNNSLSNAPRGKRKRSMEHKTDEILSLVDKKLNTMQPPDPFDTFGQHVANKLRALTPQQNIIAQKLINDVLFEGDMEALNRNFKVVEVDTLSNMESQNLTQFFKGFQ
ncbi:uncharacterized protein LOC124556414 [Schistocerca americana]|uniref:uncharacterized protein LOC124556414 n=1 Tax=Schistocerca americana TaxID=7009 RepID=UPI001F4FA45A|nr:uncharacterized protein LOC124556414 [Schistocerca americana]XP_049954640.1 uncharacterized protein LOC126470683 [Schistocerca serialis cubense]